MSFFPWSDEYSVHLRVIDNDHKDLVATVNELHDAIREGSAKGQIGQIITNLAHYVDDHFAREEALMEAYDYPGLADHKRIHRHLTRMVYAIRTVFAAKPMEIDPAKLLRFLRDWLIHHIVEEDRKYVPFLRGDDGGRSVPSADAGDHVVAGVISNGHAPDLATGKTETLTLTVPADKAAVLRRCARFLAEGGVESIAIEDVVSPVSKMTFDEAHHFAKPILRKRA
ncbi:MAG: hemerythrin [Paracoccaceae bacterium]|jgi:hemerythrin